MKRPVLLALAGIIFFMVLACGCTAPDQGTTTPAPVTTTPAVAAQCDFTTCHGLDLACGTDPPEACTAIYVVGDKCRRFAYCSTAGGGCTLVTTPEFTACRACVNRCGGADDTEIFICEERC